VSPLTRLAAFNFIILSLEKSFGTAYFLSSTVSASDTALKDITISGVGTLNFSIGETSISGISLAQFSGTSTVTIDATSNVNLTGGTGADTLQFGSTFNADTVNGGAGTDTLLAGLDGIVNLGRVTNVEVGTFSATGGFEADASGSTFTTINVVDVAAAAIALTMLCAFLNFLEKVRKKVF
jgi:Ca2+-binding RTX toxin-like protein